jgi:PAS domain-containing protein
MDSSKIKIETNNRKYQELIEVPNAVIFHLDRDWNYSSLNLEWTHLTAYTVDETLVTPFFEICKRGRSCHD